MSSALTCNSNSAKFEWPFKLILVLMFFEYVRPQSGLLPFLSVFRLPMFMILILTFKALSDKKWVLSDTGSNYFFLLFLLCVAHVPFAVNNFYAFEITRAMMVYFLTYMAIKAFINSIEKVEYFLNFWLIIGCACSIRGSLGGGKIIGSGFLGDENDFALYLTMMIPIAYVNIISKNSFKVKVFNFIVIALLIIGIISSFSRGGFVGLVGVAFYCFLITPRKILAILFLSVVLASSIPFVPHEYKEEIGTIFEGTAESTAGERVYLWNIAMVMFYDNPVFGVGPGNYPWRVPEYESSERTRGRGHGGRPVHSLYFTLIPELGLVGCVCVSVLIISPYLVFRRCRKIYLQFSATFRQSKKAEIDRLNLVYKSVYGVLFGYLFSGVFLSVLYYPHLWIICGVLTATGALFQKCVRQQISTLEAR